MRPKVRGREQGTDTELCPLRLNTTESAFKKGAQLCSTANGPAACEIMDGLAAACSAVPDCERKQTATTSRTTRRQTRRRNSDRQRSAGHSSWARAVSARIPEELAAHYGRLNGGSPADARKQSHRHEQPHTNKEVLTGHLGEKGASCQR